MHLACDVIVPESQITNRSGEHKTKSMKYNTRTNMQLKTAPNHESWQPLIPLSVPVQHICHLVELSCPCHGVYLLQRHQMNFDPQTLPS